MIDIKRPATTDRDALAPSPGTPTPRYVSRVSPPETATRPHRMRTSCTVSPRDAPASGNTDPHKEVLARAETKTAAIRYAVNVLDGAPPAEIMAWLANYGYTVSRSKVSPEVNEYRREHGRTDDQGTHQPTSTTVPNEYQGHTDTETGDRGHIGQAAATRQVSDIPLRYGDTQTAQPPTPGHHNAENTHPLPNNTTPKHDNDLAKPTVEPATAPPREQRPPWVVFACYAAAIAALAVSLNTSWRFFDRVLHIPTAYGERYVMFAVAELALVVCGAGMTVNVHRDGRPGSFRLIVWSMCAAMAYMAWIMSTPEEALGRILLGPLLGTTMLHLGLGIELRAHHQHTSTLARIGRELRERILSRLGLADDGRDAAQRTKDRKAYAAAALSRPQRWPWSRQARLERALLAAGVADDPAMRDRMLARLAVVRHAHGLATLTQPSPWLAPVAN
jgi:hypothetical protein